LQDPCAKNGASFAQPFLRNCSKILGKTRS
jgi:hypothetical protein